MSNAATTTLCAMMLAATLSLHAAAAGPSPVGTWRTVDDEDGKESGSVTIYDSGGLLYGSVASIADPARAGAICSLCTDDRRDKPVVGMQIIRGMKPDGAAWDGGEILDPKKGKVYRCSMRLEDGGAKLVVRGYVGISLIGRSQTWLRK